MPPANVIITAPGTYKFQSITNGQPDNINSITVDPTCPAGDVNLYIRRDEDEVTDPNDPNQLWGALNVDLIDLSGPAVTYLREVRVQGTVAADGPVIAHDVAGLVKIGDSVLNTVYLDAIEAGAELIVGDTIDPAWSCGEAGSEGLILGDVTIGTLEGKLGCQTLRKLTVLGNANEIWMCGTWGVPDPNAPGGGGDPNDIIAIGGDLYGILYFGLEAAGTIDVAGDLRWLDLESGQGADLSGAVRVGGKFETLFDVRDVTGTIDVGDLGVVTIARHLTGTVRVRGSTDDEFLFSVIAGQWSGTLEIEGQFRGAIWNGFHPWGDDPVPPAPMSGGVRVGWCESGPPGHCYGEIVIGDDDGPVFYRDLTGQIDIAGDLYGQITIWGSLGDANDPTPYAGHIAVGGGFTLDPTRPEPPPAFVHIAQDIVGPGAFVCIDYDGDGVAGEQSWDPNAVIVTWSADPNTAVEYTANTPAKHFWETSPCRGDFNGDGAVNFGDINLFTVAYSSPATYSAAFPGLGCSDEPNDPNCTGGSRIWHGDCNCDGAFGFGDINPFIQLVINEHCTPDCQDRDDAPALPPAVLAAAIREHLDLAQQPSFLTIVEMYLAAERDAGLQQYWQTVREALME